MERQQQERQQRRQERQSKHPESGSMSAAKKRAQEILELTASDIDKLLDSDDEFDDDEVL